MPTKVVLRWNTRALGCLFLPMLGCALLFALAAVDPSIVADMAEQHRGAFLRTGQAGEFNWIAFAVSVGLLGFALKAGWRWADRVAVSADDRGMAFHPSILRKPLRWSEIETVAFVPIRRSGSLTVRTRAGDLFAVRQVDPDSGPEFARVVCERWLALPPSPPPM